MTKESNSALLAKLFEEYTIDLSEAIAMLVAVIAIDLPDPAAVFLRIEEMAIEPELGDNPVAKSLLFNVARLTAGYRPKTPPRA